MTSLDEDYEILTRMRNENNQVKQARFVRNLMEIWQKRSNAQFNPITMLMYEPGDYATASQQD